VPVVLAPHETRESAMRAALDRSGALDAVLEAPTLIRIEAGQSRFWAGARAASSSPAGPTPRGRS